MKLIINYTSEVCFALTESRARMKEFGSSILGEDDLRKEEWSCELEASIFVSIHMTQTLAFFALLVEMNEIAPNTTKPKILCSHS